MRFDLGVCCVVFVVVSGSAVNATTLAPDSVFASTYQLMIEEVGQVGTADSANNYASPVAVGNDLLIVDQTGRLQRQTATGFETILDQSNAPSGLTLTGNQAILNVADGPGDTVFVAFTSSTLPQGATAAELPDAPLYSRTPTLFQVVYKYQRDASGNFVQPERLAAFEAATSGHTGGGLLALPDGNVLFATGDNLTFNRDGLSAPQYTDEHVSKLLIIDSNTGDVSVAAKGVRNVQQITYADAAQTKIAFGDIGGTTAEEVNVIAVADLVDTATVENFGWGRNADGNAREGTFYINDGATSVPGTLATAIGVAPTPEAGFIQPFAQFGRPVGQPFIAISGPISSETSFNSIDLLFSDLSQGGLFATTDGLDGMLNDVFSIGLVDENGNPTTLLSLSGATRTDPRLFNFTDGSVGVLLEGTGKFYRLTEIASVPLPSGVISLLSALFGFAALRRSRSKAQPSIN